MAKKPISILQGQFYTMTQKKLLRPSNTDDRFNCLRQAGQLHYRLQSLCEQI